MKKKLEYIRKKQVQQYNEIVQKRKTVIVHFKQEAWTLANIYTCKYHWEPSWLGQSGDPMKLKFGSFQIMKEILPTVRAKKKTGKHEKNGVVFLISFSFLIYGP